MDPVTHGLIGASVSQSVADSQEIRWAALIGAAGAMLPDLDVLIGTSADPLMNLEYHRQFTHSFIFIPFGALIVAVLLWWPLKTKLTFQKIYLYSLLGVATAGIADTFTSYGVQLFWPLTDTRFSWNLISVFDPLFSLGLIIGVGTALYKKKTTGALFALCWMVIYLLFAVTQKQEAHITAEALARQRNHFTEKIIVKPTIGNQLLWSARYVRGNQLYADAIGIIPFSEPKIYQGESEPLLPWQKMYSEYKGTTLYKDIKRFEVLSNEILVEHPEHPQVIGDGRYSMLPTTIRPLWGIRIDTTRPNSHVDFETLRDTGPEIRQVFLNMVLGVKETNQ
ncbi:MAG: metal-dependent hydrolase [Balneolaceae bacterium]|nr:metal-dependent hydrolase [Balneolaceae bacterium]